MRPHTDVADLMANVGFNVRRVRRRCGLTQHELAALSRVSRQVIANVETRQTRDVYLSTLLRLMHAMGAAPSELFYRPADFVVEAPSFAEEDDDE